MRNTKTALLCCTVLASMGLLGTPAAMATGSLCSSFTPTVTVLLGPCPVSGASPTACEPQESVTGFTGIKYRVTGSPDYVAALVTANNVVVSGGQSYPACAGDPVTDLGERSCHEKAVAFGCSQVTSDFWIVVQGQKGAVLQSVAVKRGICIKSFAVAGLGYDLNPFQATQKVETVNFKGCAVRFQYDVVSGAVVSAALDPTQSTKPACAPGQNDGTCCAFNGGEDVSHLELTLNGQTLGTGQFGQGYVSSGTNSCTTRVLGGRVYTWGAPCP
jgi:hypothetical protein